MSRSSSRATVERYADPPRPPREFVNIPMSLDMRDIGWRAFEFVGRELRRLNIEPERLVWRYTEENYAEVVAVFEVAPRG